MQPRHNRETVTPVRPRVVYFIAESLAAIGSRVSTSGPEVAFFDHRSLLRRGFIRLGIVRGRCQSALEAEVEKDVGETDSGGDAAPVGKVSQCPLVEGVHAEEERACLQTGAALECGAVEENVARQDRGAVKKECIDTCLLYKS